VAAAYSSRSAFGADGALLWAQAYNGPWDLGYRVHSIALGPGGVVYVADASEYSAIHETEPRSGHPEALTGRLVRQRRAGRKGAVARRSRRWPACGSEVRPHPSIGVGSDERF
jgi:hypothetical protein